ncbi:MAG: hypothetical protein HKO89_08605, partial [Saprospiraceae bacterium]|nr:hypothetical protein [Saprospiraceae bacterium]
MGKLTSWSSLTFVLFIFQTFFPDLDYKSTILIEHETTLSKEKKETLYAPPAFQPAAPTVVPAGSLIIDMGVVPQTIANGLKPYGLIFELINSYGVTVLWVIDQNKMSDKNTGFDDIDFSYNGQDFKGGPFIVPATFRTPEINAVINTWIAKGVQTVTTTSD